MLLPLTYSSCQNHISWRTA